MSAQRWSAGFLLALLLGAAPQGPEEREARTREYVQFLVLQLDQWSQEFPRQFYLAALRPPVDAGQLSESGKAAAGELGDSIARLAKLADAKDVVRNAGFRSQLDKTLAAAREVNQVLAAQRFPAILESDWEQIRSTLNSLARVYKVATLAVLDRPDSGGRKQTAAHAPDQAAGLAGYIVDLSCARRGKAMWANSECVARCIRDGDKIVLVTGEGKIYQIANQDRITPDSYGQMVTVTGKTEGDTITVSSLKM